ncbi:TIGR02206 family membrane protein [Bacillus coahuilensis]|nr:TIGR02206 family membrane protein [Bacillus coahuilensis]
MKTFQLFSTSHLAVIGIFTLIFILFLLSKNFFAHSKKHSSVGYILLMILIFSEVSYQIWALSVGAWTMEKFIPIHLCSFATFLGIFLFFKKNEKLFSFYFYLGIIPPMLAIITPDLVYEFPHYRFIKFFIHHATIPLMVIYIKYTKQYTIHFPSVFYGFLWLNILAVPIFLFNRVFSTNYFFLGEAPEEKTALSFFGEGYAYYLNLEIAAFGVFLLTYLLSRIPFVYSYVGDMIVNKKMREHRTG